MKNKKFDNPEDATPIQDYSFLKISWVQTQKDLNRAETENIAAAQKKYLKKPVKSPAEWFEPNSLKKIHKEMYGDVWEWAGEYRKEITSIGVKPAMIPARLAELCHEIKYWFVEPIELTFVEQAARIHHKLVLIHPFENGNGRFSRLIADRYLLYWDCQYPKWPMELEKKGYDDVALTLVKHGADIRFRDKSGYDPFEMAISRSNFKLAKELLIAGYPYSAGVPTPIKLLQHHAKLYEFEMQFLNSN